jgi:hydroxyacylglutathione hydrolase
VNGYKERDIELQIDTFVLGDFETNCYVVRSTNQAKECLIIDPGYEAESVVEFLKEKDLAPKRILLTHGHCDHIAGIAVLQENFDPIPISISCEDDKMLTHSRHNLSLLMGQPLKFAPPDDEIAAGDVIELDGVRLEVLATPGHTPGGVSFYCPQEELIFTGDTLFAGSVGRTDFPGGSMSTLLQSIREQLLVLPDQTKVYSGHGPATTIGQEKRGNPFIQ